MPTLVLKLKGRELQTLPITKTHTTIGRDLGCDLVIDNPAVSRQHARVEYQAGKFVVLDTGSQNGILVGGHRTRLATLLSGMEVQVGKFTITFISVGGVPADELEIVRLSEMNPVDESAGVTTHLDPEYVQQMRQSFDARDRARALTRRETLPEIQAAKRFSAGLIITVLASGILVLTGLLVYVLLYA